MYNVVKIKEESYHANQQNKVYLASPFFSDGQKGPNQPGRQLVKAKPNNRR